MLAVQEGGCWRRRSGWGVSVQCRQPLPLLLRDVSQTRPCHRMRACHRSPGVIFGNTGGVMEAALRTAYELASGGHGRRERLLGWHLSVGLSSMPQARCSASSASPQSCPIPPCSYRTASLLACPSPYSNTQSNKPSAGQELPRLKVEAVRGLAGIKEATLRLPDTAPPGVAGREVRARGGLGLARLGLAGSPAAWGGWVRQMPRTAAWPALLSEPPAPCLCRHPRALRRSCGWRWPAALGTPATCCSACTTAGHRPTTLWRRAWLGGG